MYSYLYVLGKGSNLNQKLLITVRRRVKNVSYYLDLLFNLMTSCYLGMLICFLH